MNIDRVEEKRGMSLEELYESVFGHKWEYGVFFQTLLGAGREENVVKSGGESESTSPVLPGNGDVRVRQ